MKSSLSPRISAGSSRPPSSASPALLGFAASRFVMASASRPADTASSGQSMQSSAASSYVDTPPDYSQTVEAAMPDSEHQRSLSDLLTGLAGDISSLFRKEIQLAKTEASEKIDEVIDGSKGLIIGVVLAIGAFGIFLTALVTGLSWLLVSFGMSQQAASFVAPLAVALIAGGIAWSFISRGSTP